jgi:hypothetical protein
LFLEAFETLGGVLLLPHLEFVAPTRASGFWQSVQGDDDAAVGPVREGGVRAGAETGVCFDAHLWKYGCGCERAGQGDGRGGERGVRPGRL